MDETMIQPCTGCGRLILLHRIANLVVKADPAPLTDVGDILKLIAGPNPPSLWAVETNQAGQPNRLRGARPGETGVVPEHRCTNRGTSNAVMASLPASKPNGATPGPKEPPAGRTTPSSAPQGLTVDDAARQASDAPACDRCGKPCADGTYAAVQLGDIYMWAQHLADYCNPSDAS